MSRADHMSYQPPFTLTSTIVHLVAEISEMVGKVSAQQNKEKDLRLRRINRIRTIQGSLAIEGNTLSEAQITAIIEGKRVLAPPREIQEARNAIKAYEGLLTWQATSEQHLLQAHSVMTLGLVDDPGVYRRGGVGVMKGDQVIHMAPPADRVAILMRQLMEWIGATDHHPLIVSSVFHYEFEFIHPFSDGNGRMGRLWQTLILSHWNPLLGYMPVESMVHESQTAYYQALNDSTLRSDSAPFIEFMLGMLLKALEQAAGATPQVSPQHTPQVIRLLHILEGSMSREELQQALGLTDRKSFRARYLLPALAAGYIEMTSPDRPNSKLQRYRLTQSGKAARLGPSNPI